jgi:hypothetical protein
MFSTTFITFGQKFSETDLAFGIVKITAPMQQNYWNDSPLPRYQRFSITKSWYKDDHWFSLRKELGINFQYSKIDLASGGLGAQGYYSGHIISLFGEAAILARFRINSTLAFSIGPVAEILAIANNDLTYSYSFSYSTPPSSGLKVYSVLSREFFNSPSYGIKARLFESALTENKMIGLSVSYLWTKQKHSNFYASNYTTITLYIGFKRKK